MARQRQTIILVLLVCSSSTWTLVAGQPPPDTKCSLPLGGAITATYTIPFPPLLGLPSLGLPDLNLPPLGGTTNVSGLGNVSCAAGVGAATVTCDGSGVVVRAASIDTLRGDIGGWCRDPSNNRLLECSDPNAVLVYDSKWGSGVLAPNGKIYCVPLYASSVLIIDPVAASTENLTLGSNCEKCGSMNPRCGLNPSKWRDSVLAPNGKIYGIPYSAQAVLIIDPVAASTDTLGYFPGYTNEYKWVSGVLAPNGIIYGIPKRAEAVLMIDPVAGSVDDTTLARAMPGPECAADGRPTVRCDYLNENHDYVNLHYCLGRCSWSGGVLAPNGKIYGIPSRWESGVLIIDPVTASIDIIMRSTIPHFRSGWSGGVLAPNGKIYGIPTDRTVLIIDPASNSTDTITLSSPFIGIGGVLAANGKIYSIPVDAGSGLIIDPVGASTDTTTLSTLTSDCGNVEGVLAPNGKIYGIPSRFSHSVLIIDPGNAPPVFSFSGCPCNRGYFAPNTTTPCTVCPPGSITDTLVGASTCTVCPIGRFSANSTSCLPCPNGLGASADGSRCENCTANRYLSCGVCQLCAHPNVKIGNNCVPPSIACPVGETASVDSATHIFDESGACMARRCQKCPVGQASIGRNCTKCNDASSPNRVTNADQSGCSVCAPGKEPNDIKNLCIDCVGTNYSSFGTCINCPAPSIVNGERTSCIHCLPGRQPNHNRTQCQACTGSTYSQFGSTCEPCPLPNVVNSNHTGCVPCTSGHEPNSNGTKCVLCSPGYFSVVGKECLFCPDGQYTGGRGCVTCTHCPRTSIRGQSHFVDDELCPGTALNAGRRCANNYTGFLCTSCEDGFHKGHQGICNFCDTQTTVTPERFGMFCAALLSLILAVRCRLRRRQSINPRTSTPVLMENLSSSTETSNPVHSIPTWTETTANDLDAAGPFTSVQETRRMRCCSYCHKYALRVPVIAQCAFQPMRIIVTYLQVTSQLGSVLHIHYPKRFAQMMRAMKIWLDVFGLVFSAECAHLGSFEARWLLRVVGLPSALSLLALIHCVVLHKSRSRQKATSSAKVEFRKQLQSDMFFVVFFAYPTVCNEVFSTFNCLALDTAANTTLAQRSVLTADDRMFCDDLQVWHLLSAVVIVCFGCGVPLAFGGLLIHKARKYTAKSNADVSAGVLTDRIARELDIERDTLQYMLRDLALGTSGFGFLLDAYKPKFLFWESCDILRKLALVGLVVVLGQGSVDQIMVAAVLSFAFFGLQVHCRPYKIEHDNHFRLITEVHVFLTILVAFALHSNNASADLEVIPEDRLDWALTISFILCIPAAFLVTVLLKVAESKASLAGTEVKSAFARLQLGLATVADRTTMTAYIARATLAVESTQTRVVVWMHCSDDFQFHPVEPSLGSHIEDAYTRGESELQLSTGECVNFECMTLSRSKHDEHPCALRRRVLTSSADMLPPDWSPMPSGTNFMRTGVERSEEPALWQRVEARVHVSLPAFRVSKIERLQNLRLWRKFEQFCWDHCNNDGSSTLNEKELFHYAPVGVLEKITESASVGFDPRIGRGEYGSGTYFAQHPVYCAALAHDWLFAGIDPAGFGPGGKFGGDGDDIPLGTPEQAAQLALESERTAPGSLVLIWGRVALGHCKDFGARCSSARGNAAADRHEMRRGLHAGCKRTDASPWCTGGCEWPRLGDGQGLNRPPPRPEAGPNELWDSVSGTEGDLQWTMHPRLRARGAELGRQYVTFHPDQAYPELVITLKRQQS